MKILMVAAENGALPGGKVGGIGDVVRDIPGVLAAQGHQVDVVTPGYNMFSRLPGAEHRGYLQVMFAGRLEGVNLYEVPATQPQTGVTLWALEHPLFAVGGIGQIYCDDPANRPFASDASKFALFSAAVAQAVMEDRFGVLDVMHLHDWHAAPVAVLRAFDPMYRKLQSIHTVYTIHNLALQGIRPLEGDESSLSAWYPNLPYDWGLLNDPRAPHCFNPMRAGINLSDKVQAVSPTYAREILKPSIPEQGFIGGEGLEQDLQRAADVGRLQGILNGCEYSDDTRVSLPLDQVVALCEEEALNWLARQPIAESCHVVAIRRLAQLALSLNDERRPFVVTSVGRITDQKVRLLRQEVGNGKTALDEVLDALGEAGVFIMLGSGTVELEHFLTQASARNRNFIYLKGYSEKLPPHLYSCGDLFLMPSSFEPCGISQMLAMRDGQPCLVHSVGGLSDTVQDEVNGFSFVGENLDDQARNMISRFREVMDIKLGEPDRWRGIAKNAASTRFLWGEVAEQYVRLLYQR